MTAYLDFLSTLFMDIGRTAPRNQAIAFLYPRSQSLQSHINEYFIVVVNICQHIMDFARKSTFSKLKSSLDTSDLKALQSDLAKWSEILSDELSLQVATKITEEVEQASRFRNISKKFSKSAAEQHRSTAKLRLLNQCSKFDYQTSWKQLRKIGNTTVLNEFKAYNQWKENGNHTLLCTGTLGCGKSVIFANIVEDLVVHLEKKKAYVAYFFCRHDITESLQPRTIVGSIVRQLLLHCSVTEKLEVYTHATSLDYKDMRMVLRENLSSEYSIYIVVDGLDACNALDRGEVATELLDLRQHFMTSLCLSHRMESDTDLAWAYHDAKNLQVVPLPDNSPDIDAFIQSELERNLENGALTVGDPTLPLEIQDALTTGSQGMFLWAQLQLGTICSMQTDEEIRIALPNLPRDLSEVYRRNLERSTGSSGTYQRCIFELVLAAKRPLTIDELQEALSVTPGNTVWTEAKLLNNVYSALGSCGPLLMIDEEELTVRMVHPSVSQFLLCSYRDLAGHGITKESTLVTIADVLVTYLSYGVFGTELSTNVFPQISVKALPSKVITSTGRTPGIAQKLALKLLRSRKQPNFDIGKTLAGARDAERQPQLRFPLYEYAKSFTLQHIFLCNQSTPHVNKLLPPLMRRQKMFEDLISDTLSTDDNILHIAARYNNSAVYELLFDPREPFREVLMELFDFDGLNSRGETPLQVAIRHDAIEMAELLLKHVSSIEQPFFEACSGGNARLVQLFLDAFEHEHHTINILRLLETLAIVIRQRHDNAFTFLLGQMNSAEGWDNTIDPDFYSRYVDNILLAAIAVVTTERWFELTMVLKSKGLQFFYPVPMSRASDQLGSAPGIDELLEVLSLYRWMESSLSQASIEIAKIEFRMGRSAETFRVRGRLD
jgi:hypothetical protein